MPVEVTIVSVQKTGPTDAQYVHTNAGGGSGSVHDMVADTFSNLPVGPGGGSEFALCGYSGASFTLPSNPPPNQGWWLVFRGRNACGPGSYGNTHTNPGPPLNGPPRASTTCP